MLALYDIVGGNGRDNASFPEKMKTTVFNVIFCLFCDIFGGRHACVIFTCKCLSFTFQL